MLGGDRKELARYVALSQVGLMLAAPPGLGALLDVWLGTLPWCVVVGAVVGLTTGLVQLIRLTDRADAEKPDEK